MPKLTVHTESYDSELRKVRKARIEIAGKTVTTPSRALSLGSNLSESRLIKNKKIRGINEVHKKLVGEQIKRISDNAEEEVNFNKKFKGILDKSNLEKELNFPLFSFENKNRNLGNYQNTLPTPQEMAFICDTMSHPFLDVIIPPSLPGLFTETYLKFLESFFQELKSRSYDKPIIGFLPFVSRTDLPKLVDFYVGNEIFSFVVDFQAHNPIDIVTHVELVHGIVREIRRQYNEEIYLHAFNVPFTRIRQRTDTTPAKDIVTFLLGFDSFGTNHLPQKSPLDVIQKINERRGKRFVTWNQELRDLRISKIPNRPESFRIFNRGDYGYYRSDLENIDSLISPEDEASIKLTQIYNEKMYEEKIKATRKAFNVERHALEAIDLQTVIAENSTKEHLQGKRYLREKWTDISRANAS